MHSLTYKHISNILNTHCCFSTVAVSFVLAGRYDGELSFSCRYVRASKEELILYGPKCCFGLNVLCKCRSEVLPCKIFALCLVQKGDC